MRLLLTNDDGIYAEGIRTLAAELAKEHDVVIVAPDSERSENSQKITIRTPLKVKKTTVTGLNVPCYMTDGSPADCTRLGLFWLEDHAFDAVITGINHGSNIGTDVLYSGTVGAAREAAMHNIPALAVSLTHCQIEYLSVAARFARHVVASGVLSDLPRGTMLNLNVPSVPYEQVRGVKWVRHGYNDLTEQVEHLSDGALFRGIPRVGYPIDFEDDFTVLDEGWASLTPLDLDLNNDRTLERLRDAYRFDALRTAE